METRTTSFGSVKKCVTPCILFLIGFWISTSCQEDSAQIDLLQATPVNALILIPVENDKTFQSEIATYSPVPHASKAVDLVERLPLKEGKKGLLSLHRVGTGTLFWVYAVKRNATDWQAATISSFEPKRRAYSKGSIWEWEDEAGSWALSETGEWLVLSHSDILAAEAIRQLEEENGNTSYTHYASLNDQLAEGGFVTLNLEDESPLHVTWPLWEDVGLPDDMRTWRYLQPGSLHWTLKETADHTAKIAVSTPQFRSEKLAFADSTSARVFPGWRWLTPSLEWTQWTAVDGRMEFNGRSFAIQAQGVCKFKGRDALGSLLSMRYAPNHGLKITHWTSTQGLEAHNELGLNKPLSVHTYFKTVGDYLVACRDTFQANQSLAYLSDSRNMEEEKAYGHSVQYLRSQPHEAQIWWVCRQDNPDAPWAGLTYRADGEKAYWSASVLLPKS